MKKFLIAILSLVFIVVGFVFSLAWYAGYKLKSGERIWMHKDDSLIAIIEEKAFSNTFSCLSFSSGIIFHGQDTFELVKFCIKPDDPSWNVLSNRIYTSEECVLCEDDVLSNGQVGVPVLLRDLATVGEVVIGRRNVGETSLYLTMEKDTGERFIYLKGSLIPVSKVERR
jgi:hypothetical protein